MKRVVITGLGIVSPLGCELDTFWENVKAGKSGIDKITKFDATDYASQIAGEVSGFEPDEYVSKKEQRRMDEYSLFGVVAAQKAFKDSGLDMSKEDPARAGVIVGSGVGGLQTLEKQHSILMEKGPSKCSPFMIPHMISNICGGLIAIDLGLKGPNYSVVSACASAAHSMADGQKTIQRGEADIMLCGGAEASVCKLGVAGFAALRALSTRNDDPQGASRPFDKEREGFVIADGSGILVLEEYEHAVARGAKIYCEMAGSGASCDAYHITAPSSDGSGAAQAINQAMADAGVTSSDVDYINAHGTSTPLNDKVETLAIKMALGDDASKVCVSSLKSMTGHMLGAAAGAESIVCALAIRDGVAPPTINYTTPDPECDLDYVPNESRDLDIKVCLKNSLGFGGHNACLAFKKV
jgi:3-oxoacyl-[acyl-carrier-protein] synthase II